MKTNTRTVAAVWIGLLATAPVIFSIRNLNDALELRTVVTQLAAEVRSLKAEILRRQVEASERECTSPNSSGTAHGTSRRDWTRSTAN